MIISPNNIGLLCRDFCSQDFEILCQVSSDLSKIWCVRMSLEVEHINIAEHKYIQQCIVRLSDFFFYFNIFT